MSRLARICLTKLGEKNWIVKDIDFTISKPCFCDTPNPGVFFFFAYV